MECHCRGSGQHERYAPSLFGITIHCWWQPSKVRRLPLFCPARTHTPVNYLWHPLQHRWPIPNVPMGGECNWSYFSCYRTKHLFQVEVCYTVDDVLTVDWGCSMHCRAELNRINIFRTVQFPEKNLFASSQYMRGWYQPCLHWLAQTIVECVLHTASTDAARCSGGLRIISTIWGLQLPLHKYTSQHNDRDGVNWWDTEGYTYATRLTMLYFISSRLAWAVTDWSPQPVVKVPPSAKRMK